HSRKCFGIGCCGRSPTLGGSGGVSPLSSGQNMLFTAQNAAAAGYGNAVCPAVEGCSAAACTATTISKNTSKTVWKSVRRRRRKNANSSNRRHALQPYQRRHVLRPPERFYANPY